MDLTISMSNTSCSPTPSTLTSTLRGVGTWGRNMGGGIAVPQSEEGYHEMMDIAESMVNRDAHEKCMHASGEGVNWDISIILINLILILFQMTLNFRKFDRVGWSHRYHRGRLMGGSVY